MKIKKRILKTYQTLKCFFLQKISNKYIVIRASVKVKNNKLVKANWGDDFNIALLEKLTHKKVLLLPNNRLSLFLSIPNYLVIGSIISFFPLKNTTVWGAGLLNSNEAKKINLKPKKILAVRGPKTREELLKIGIDCPEVYGDPALLAPYIYTPKKNKQYILGIIPHYIDLDNNNVKQLLRNNDVKLINVIEYDDWREFIDQVNSCEYIISLSLHGLIISEAYGIPTKWVKFGEYPNDWNFKFIDFYESIFKYDIKPLLIDDSVSFSNILEEVKKWKKTSIDVNGLIKTCPFKIYLD